MLFKPETYQLDYLGPVEHVAVRGINNEQLLAVSSLGALYESSVWASLFSVDRNSTVIVERWRFKEDTSLPAPPYELGYIPTCIENEVFAAYSLYQCDAIDQKYRNYIGYIAVYRPKHPTMGAAL